MLAATKAARWRGWVAGGQALENGCASSCQVGSQAAPRACLWRPRAAAGTLPQWGCSRPSAPAAPSSCACWPRAHLHAQRQHMALCWANARAALVRGRHKQHTVSQELQGPARHAPATLTGCSSAKAQVKQTGPACSCTCSRVSCSAPSDLRADRMESISSMKMTAGCSTAATAKSVRTCAHSRMQLCQTVGARCLDGTVVGACELTRQAGPLTHASSARNLVWCAWRCSAGVQSCAGPGQGRAIFSPSPIHLLVREEAEMLKKVALMLLAMALPIRVLPVPGGPNSSNPLGGARAPCMPRLSAGLRCGHWQVAGGRWQVACSCLMKGTQCRRAPPASKHCDAKLCPAAHGSRACNHAQGIWCKAPPLPTLAYAEQLHAACSWAGPGRARLEDVGVHGRPADDLLDELLGRVLASDVIPRHICACEHLVWAGQAMQAPQRLIPPG